jgi:lipopolysaccharide/colanic/teichoic acid biosynthesis glycosyltransferase
MFVDIDVATGHSTRVEDSRKFPERIAAAHPGNSWYLLWKVAFESALSLLLLILISPLILIAAVAVKLTSHGPAFYSQTRVGKSGRRFRIYKIRTMVHNCERSSGATWSRPGDTRITAVGRFLRATHMDEFPQLLNVLRGEMSLVGPRPERPEIIPDLERAVHRYSDRLAVRPGITGLAQVYLPADTDMDSVRRKLVHDLYYIRHGSFRLDLKLLFCTGLYLSRLPFHRSCRLFRVPSPAVIERAVLEREFVVPPLPVRMGMATPSLPEPSSV